MLAVVLARRIAIAAGQNAIRVTWQNLLVNDTTQALGAAAAPPKRKTEIFLTPSLPYVLQQVRVFQACSNANGVGALPAGALP